MNIKYFIVLILVGIIIAACGTVAEPVPNSATLAAESAHNTDETSHSDGEETNVVQAPTNTPQPPTATPEPPTATPTLVPPSPTPEPTEEMPAEGETAGEYQLTADDELILFFVESGSPTRGETLFNTTYTVAMAGGNSGDWACSVCHNVQSAEAGVGPGMLGLPDRAAERIPGMPAPVYLYHSIVNPHEYVVEGFSDGVMPVGYADVFSETELYDIVSYLLSLPSE
ncbi:MAG: hypothetical protein CUN56_09375 [Phototrophicales bacterium]|nr:MAG: hypothetical protein CUN56_09375 [Phototrophicales bacterium]